MSAAAHKIPQDHPSELPTALWVVPVGEFGGVARHVLDAACAGIPGYRLTVCAPEGKLTERLRELQVPVHAVPFGPHAGFKTSYASLLQVIKSEKPAIVHSHLAYADALAAAVVTSLRIRAILNRSLPCPKLVTTEHGIAGDDAVYHGASWRSRLMEQVHRVRLWVTDAAIAVSESTAEQMRRKWGARTVTVIYNGVDTSHIRAAVQKHRVQASAQAPRILSLSRLSPEKGIQTLLEAFVQVHAREPQAHLEIAGEGEQAQTLRQQAQDLGLSESVTFSGFVDPLEAMGRSDLIVQLSVWENCSYTLLDAQAAGLKTVATAVGGNPEILGPEALVNPHTQDMPSAVAARILQQLHTPTQTPLNWISTQAMTERIARIYGRTAGRNRK